MKKSRIHWLLHKLPKDFKMSYRLYYDYKFHRYLFYRNYRYSLRDVFIIVRTSRKCWRVSYVNTYCNRLDYFSCKSLDVLIEFMYSIFLNFPIE